VQRVRSTMIGSSPGDSPSRMAVSGHTATQLPHLSQSVAVTFSSGPRFWPSGLQHQRQLSGQPLRNTVVRMPGPSTNEPWMIWNTSPFGGASTLGPASTLTTPRTRSGR